MDVLAITRGAREGCTAPGCGKQKTLTVDVVWGRRCAAHSPRFHPGHAVDLARSLGITAAMRYIRTPLAGEA